MILHHFRKTAHAAGDDRQPACGCFDDRYTDTPLRTITTKDRLGLVSIAGLPYQIIDIGMRMLQPEELKRASGFDPDYLLHGTKRDQVCQVGNAVNAPAECELVTRCIDSIG